MDNILKKIKHLRATMLQYATVKFKGKAMLVYPDNPSRKWPNYFAEDFKYIDQTERILIESGYLTKNTMKKCNKLYDKYGTIYEK